MRSPQSTPHLAALQASFLAILPRIELHGKIHFRDVTCPVRRQEALAEMVAMS